MVKNVLNTLNKIPTSRQDIKDQLEELKDRFAEEGEETVEMWRIYERYVYGLATQEEIEWANEQALDVARTVGLAGVIVFPGTIFVLPLLIKLGNRFGITILPSAFRK